MKLNALKVNEGSKKIAKRVGRGTSSGMGKTSGKGHKGQKARSGYSRKAGFEGGQLPLYRRLPKRGFSNANFKKEYAVINLSDLNRFDENTVITPELLKETGIIKKQLAEVKVLGKTCSAYSDKEISKDKKVKILSISGVKLKVEEKEVILDERKAKKIVLEHDEKKKNKKKCC